MSCHFNVRYMGTCPSVQLSEHTACYTYTGCIYNHHTCMSLFMSAMNLPSHPSSIHINFLPPPPFPFLSSRSLKAVDALINALPLGDNTSVTVFDPEVTSTNGLETLVNNGKLFVSY